MENFTNIVEEQSPSSKIDQNKFRKYLSKVFIWDFEKISKESFQQFPTEKKSSLIKTYSNTMQAMFDGKFVFFLSELCLSL